MNSKTETSATSSAEPQPLPKLDFHKPKSLGEAVSRLREIRESLIAQSPMPEPRKFEVVEVIHGKGASAHSHFFLATSDYKSMANHGHEEMETDEKRFEIEVDVFTEFQDLANWLPKIAANTDNMEAETWNAVKKIATEMSENVADILRTQQDDSSIRQAFRDSTQLEGLIKKLESETQNHGKLDVRENS